MKHENLGLSSDKGKLKEQVRKVCQCRPRRLKSFQQIAALHHYLEKAHQQLEQCKQEKEEEKKKLQTKLDITTAQVFQCMIHALHN